MATSVNYIEKPDTNGPSWNNSNEYPSLESNEFTYDQQQVRIKIANIEECLKGLPSIEALQAVTELEEQALILIGNMTMYANCLLSVDGSNTEARKAFSQLSELSGQIEALTKPVQMYLMTAPEEVLEKYLQHAHTKPWEFQIRHKREIANTLLSEKEESLIARMKSHGPLAFGALYEQLSSSIRCNFENPETKAYEQIGLAQAASLIRDPSEAKRKSAWRSIQMTWRQNETASAAILNGLAGWRLELSSQRGTHFLDQPLHESRIKRETLEAMMSAVWSKRSVGHRATLGMAKAFGKSKLDPWDLLAPAPLKSSELVPFDRGLGLIRDAFSDVDSTLSDFVDTMKKNRWIEGRSLPNKRTGAFCTAYPKSNSPRVFQTYVGSQSDIRTLAHELGHAYHFWMLKDLAYPQHQQAMTIAETASIFAETAYADATMKRSPELAKAIAWQNAESASSYLLNIPARFEFEFKFYERRQKGYVSAEELRELTDQAWTKWYGDSLSENEKMFWATKLHFSIPTLSFYNFPYTFGALFSLGVYAKRDEPGFWARYNALLKDTGRMTAEELALKHLGEDLTKEEFWLKSLAQIDQQVSEFEALFNV